MKDIIPRPITQQEVAVVRQALQRAALSPVLKETIESLESLKVIGKCECGCSSVKFNSPDGKEYQLADGVGYLGNGERVDIIVWGRNKQVSSLEIVDHQGSGSLPRAESVCSWEEAGKNAF